MLPFKRTPAINDLDAAGVAALHRGIITRNPFLKAWYRDQYSKYILLASGFPGGCHVELGSGGGFLKEMFREVRTSSVLRSDLDSGLVDLCLDAEAMDLPDASVDTFFMLDVFHHLRRPAAFLSEASRCLRPGGVLFMVEPANTAFSRLLYKNFHHEPFDENAPWDRQDGDGHLSGSNQALAHIVFERDLARFRSGFPGLLLERTRRHTFLSYLVSGGLSYEPLIGTSLFRAKLRALSFAELLFSPLMPLLATHMDVQIRRRP